MPARTAAEERGRRTLAALVERFELLRGNWELDYPELVEEVLAMVSGREPLCGRFAAVATDPTCTFIEGYGYRSRGAGAARGLDA